MKRFVPISVVISIVVLSDAIVVPPGWLLRSTTSRSYGASAQSNKSAPKKKVPKRCPDEQFEIGCDPPFKDHVIHEIDERCPKSGRCTAGPAIKLQNQIKNNLCATGKPVEIGITTVDQLQKAVDAMVAKHEITYGNLIPPKPEDRPKLKSLSTVDVSGNEITLGEGDVVIFQGFVVDAKHDYSFPLGLNGETVNCNNPALNWGDIAINLGETATSPECSTVNARIIPHLRPVLWERFDSNSQTRKFVMHPLPVKGLRVRITGQLFFDGSHRPRPCKVPKRRTSWEIHPVYAIDVFDLTTNQFAPLEEWAKGK